VPHGVTRVLWGLWGVLLASFVVVPALPAYTTFGVSRAMARWLKTISVSQRWGMYAPDPQRAHAYMDLVAEYDDGTSEALEESKQAALGWTTNWMWTKTRLDIWRHHAGFFRSSKRNSNRDWYLRGVCVREWRRTGTRPKHIVMNQSRRGFTSPQQVRSGAPDLQPPTHKRIAVQNCRDAIVRRMIEDDRARRR